MLKKIMVAAGVLAWIPMAGAAGRSLFDPPNVVVFFTDDHGYADLGVHGQCDDVRTPNLDQLARDGVRFTDGYVTAPQCSPSRAGLMTGRYQQRFGFEHNAAGPLPLDEVTLADRMSRAGYRTGMIGKWHLEPNWTMRDWTARVLNEPDPKPGLRIPFRKILPYYPGARGFDDYYKGELKRYWVNYGLDGAERADDGEWVNKKGYRLELQTEAALEFIDRNHENPFFLYVAYFAPHVPLEATEQYLARFPGEMPERRRYALAMISAVDDGVGKVRDKLADLGIERDTLIFFISDNGAPLKIDMKDLPISFRGGAWDGSMNTPWTGEKGTIMEGGVHVPFLAAWPGTIPSGQVCEDPVISLDVAPTCLAAAGEPEAAELEGVNLLPRLRGEIDALPDRELYWKFWRQAAVRRGRWKYLRLSDGREYLFDLESDQHEHRNLIRTHPERAAELRGKLEDWAAGNRPAGLPDEPLNSQEEKWYAHYLD
ncbi:sulfatase [Kiritimatiella glycovorans]|uniref:Arylsulfatase n=1 Tax=Kiritimatiella glycovorans TaxID=1307763 RepID=A0A0G3EKY4_9BACT|nr:sulfatase-like hydrolase/transferase [Kiritimatiella glycovorans]AKJ65425.1 Arylsulfatase precursor [Kiritimatiella glycovorans]